MEPWLEIGQIESCAVKYHLFKFSMFSEVIILNFFEIALKKIDELSNIEFLSKKNESLKNTIISLLSDGDDKEAIHSKIDDEYKKLLEEIRETSNIQIITKDKTNEEILGLLDELIIDFKEQNNLKKIESLEKKLINNLDENSFSELIKLKSQLNRE